MTHRNERILFSFFRKKPSSSPCLLPKFRSSSHFCVDVFRVFAVSVYQKTPPLGVFTVSDVLLGDDIYHTVPGQRQQEEVSVLDPLLGPALGGLYVGVVLKGKHRNSLPEWTGRPKKRCTNFLFATKMDFPRSGESPWSCCFGFKGWLLEWSQLSSALGFPCSCVSAQDGQDHLV